MKKKKVIFIWIIKNYYTDNDITHCAEEILNKIAMQKMRILKD